MLSRFVLFNLLVALSATGAPIAEPIPNGDVASLYHQCGGINWSGASECPSVASCVSQNPYYYQCVETTGGFGSDLPATTTEPATVDTSKTLTKTSAATKTATSTATTSDVITSAQASASAYVEDSQKKADTTTSKTSTKKAKTSTKTDTSKTTSSKDENSTKTTSKDSTKTTSESKSTTANDAESSVEATSVTETTTNTPSSSKSTSSSSSDSSSSGCTVTSDNVSDLDSIKSSCTSITVDGVTVSAGETLDLTNLQDGTTVTFSGKTTFAYQEWEGPLISVSGSGVTITGASGHVIDGNGALWWDGEGGNGGKTKPKFFAAHKMTGGSTISGLNIKNTPVQCFSINGASHLTIDSVTIDDSDGDVTDGGHNTDAFDVGSSDSVTIQNCVVKNQDDCLAINSGTNINFLNNECSGGHGISIGSVGGRDDNTVENVLVKDCTVTDSDNGIRIKTVYDATGSVSGVTYSGITLSGINKYGIIIEGDYENGSPTGTATDGVPITNLTVTDVSGSVADDAQEIYILVEGASDWTFTDINITGGESSKTCSGIPTGADVTC